MSMQLHKQCASFVKQHVLQKTKNNPVVCQAFSQWGVSIFQFHITSKMCYFRRERAVYTVVIIMLRVRWAVHLLDSRVYIWIIIFDIPTHLAEQLFAKGCLMKQTRFLVLSDWSVDVCNTVYSICLQDIISACDWYRGGLLSVLQRLVFLKFSWLHVGSVILPAWTLNILKHLSLGRCVVFYQFGIWEVQLLLLFDA